jgi:hypothetical protein
MDYLSIFNSFTELLNNEVTKSQTKQSLRKFFLIECRNNQKLLAIASWKNISHQFRNEALKKLRTDNAKAFYSVADKTILGKLLDKVSIKKSNETHFEDSTDSNKIISLITRLDSLRFLGEIPNELQNESKAKYTVRITNANKIILEVIEILEEQLN